MMETTTSHTFSANAQFDFPSDSQIPYGRFAIDNWIRQISHLIRQSHTICLARGTSTHHKLALNWIAQRTHYHLS